MMRIISGVRRGKKLLSLEGDSTRPTLERVKQAFFSAIQFEIAGKTVLDLFAGSGQLGLEALSRGAEFCYFNDMSAKACEIINKNVTACDFLKMSQLTCKSYIDCVKMIKSRNKKVSLVFLDPPYGNDLVNSSLELLDETGVLEKGAVIVCETADTDDVDCNAYSLRKEYRYSGIKVSILSYEGEK